jgi:(p)ppGpp synthase/HD superfamily hydrolase
MEPLLSDCVAAAKLVARLAHGDQRYSEKPYLYHLQMTVDILLHYGYPPWSIAAGWLHDTLEDTDLTHDDLVEAFGSHVADVVYACTGRGENRKARQLDISNKLAFKTDARHVKLADRMANLHVCFAVQDHRLREMYLREDPAFRRMVTQYVKDAQWDDYTRMVAEQAPLSWLV